MALRGVPVEWHRNEGSLSAAKTRMMGQAVLVTFAATGKSDTPSRAEQMYQQNSAIRQTPSLKNCLGLPIPNLSHHPQKTRETPGFIETVRSA